MAGFYEGYTKRQAQNEQAEMQDLQKAGSLLQLRQAMQAQKENEQMKSMFQQSGGNLEAVMQGALRAGRPDIAAKLAPLVEAQRKANAPQQPRVVPPGSQLLGPNNEVLHTTPFKPEKAELKAPPQRQRYNGTQVIQEELQANGTWKQIGVGPRFQPEKPEKPIAPPAAFQWTDESRTALKPIPGGPAIDKGEAGLTPENAGKVAMSRQAVEGIETVRKIIFDENGDMRRGITGAMGLPIVAGLPMNSQARIARSAIRNAIEAKLRIETGAAATESEVERTLARFMPTVADTKQSAKFKLDELEKFFKSSLSLTKGIKQPSPSENDPLGLR